MELSRRDAFRPCSRDSSGDKGQFCFHQPKQKKLIGIGPPINVTIIPYLRLLSINKLQSLICEKEKNNTSISYYNGSQFLKNKHEQHECKV